MESRFNARIKVMRKIIEKARIFLVMIKVEHTLFALPFAYLGAFIASKGIPSLEKFFWITMAMIGARTAAMAMNRYVDREFDARNPRTCNRALPRRLISPLMVKIIVILSVFLLIFSAYKLNSLCLALSPLAVAGVIFYSYTKRYTWFSHIFLGLVEACAPIGGWIAISGKLELPPFVMGTAVVFWLAGFDIIYACQDVEFDRREKLFSIPETFGIAKGLQISGFFHLIAWFLFLCAGIISSLGWWYFLGVLLTGVLLLYEHLLISPADLSRLNQAFFDVNASISIILFVFTVFDLVYGSGNLCDLL